MPWKETNVLEQRTRFLADCLADEDSMTDLCTRYGISRQTGYTWRARFTADGPAGLVDQSREPHTHPNAVAEAVMAQILALRQLHPTWGPIKLRQYLVYRQPTVPWPAPSTIGAYLQEAGLVVARRRRAHRATAPGRPMTRPTAPHQVWCLDFKGEFHTQDGQLCYPFTVTEAQTRYLLRCQALPSTAGAPVRALLTATFREWGLPTILHMDNGTPFGSTGLGGLSRLALDWLHLGIRPEYSRPGCPQDNARHERFHGTLQGDLTRDPAATLRAQQRAFRAYQTTYNTERPHAALDGLPPAALLAPSPRRYPVPTGPFCYPPDVPVRLVHTNGCIKWQGALLFVSEVLCGEQVGIVPLTSRHWGLRVGPLLLAVRDTTAQHWLHPREARPLLQLCEQEEWQPYAN